MRTTLVAVLVFAVGLLGAASLAVENEVPMSRIGKLMRALAESRDGAPEDVGVLLAALVSESLLHLKDQGLPEDVLVSLEERFAEALDAFLAHGVSQDAFGVEIAALAKELGELGEEAGLPVEILERIGLNPSAILELQGEKDLTGLEIAALAQTIIGEFAPEALPAGPPAGLPGGDDDEEGIGRPGRRP